MKKEEVQYRKNDVIEFDIIDYGNEGEGINKTDVQAEPGLVSSIASFIGYLSQIIFTIIMVGFLGNGVTRGIICSPRISDV